MAVLRNYLKDNYTKIPNDIILSELSNRAFRLLVYLYSKPDNWRIYQIRIAKDFGVTRQTVNDWFKELKEKGFVDITQKNYKGKFDYVYTLLDGTVSAFTDTEISRQGVSAFTDTEVYGHGKTPTHSKTNLNQDLLKNKTIFSNKEVSELFHSFIIMRKEMKKPVTQKAVNMLVNDLNKYSDEEKIQALTKSIKNNYVGVFPENIDAKDKSSNKRTEIVPEFKTEDVVDEETAANLKALFEELEEKE